MQPCRIAVGLSGGVDSSVTAKILLDQGHDVIGVFLKNWDSNDPQCPAAEDATDARMVAQKLGIKFYSFDFSKEYWDNVFEYFLKENKAGRTPNPDILCNRYIKFGAFLDKAKELNCQYVATGHYAKKITLSDGTAQLHIPHDTNKDQTYFLSGMTQNQLQHALFPLSDIAKPDVRRIAEDNGFITADKKDSTGICFVGERHYRTFLEEYLPQKPGQILHLKSGKKLGDHVGLPFYTIGQRRDLYIGGVKGMAESPFFVVSKDFQTNILYVSQDQDKLLGDTLSADTFNWISPPPHQTTFECDAKIRYRSESTPCTVTVTGADTLDVVFHHPVRAITPGQTVALYIGTQCLGGGPITNNNALHL